MGVAYDVEKAKIPPGYFQLDEGGDRFKRGTWKRRRGMRHTDIAKVSSAVEAIIGFEMPGTDFALMFVEGANVRGETNVDTQTDTVTQEGFGADFGAEFGQL